MMNKSVWLCALLLGCGGRPEAWDKPFQLRAAVGLNDAVAVLDASLDRALVLSSPGAFELTTHAVPVGKNVATVQASPDGSHLYVLSRGVQPRLKPDDEEPKLTVIDTTGGTPRVKSTYPFDSGPLSGLVLDPGLEWAIAYATEADGHAVKNPNEIMLVDLAHPEADAYPLTVQSVSGSPQSFVFTSALSVPNGEPRRFLVVLTEREVTLVDLSDPANAETTQVTQPLGVNQGNSPNVPVQVVFHDRQFFTDERGVERELPPELAVRARDDSSVLLLSLDAPVGDSQRPFQLRSNIVEVGGIPTTIDFVRTDAGIRLVALVGTKAALVDPDTSNVVPVSLPRAFTGITRVTEALDAGGAGTDIALLWSNSATTVGLWNLGAATASASRGLQTLEIGTAVRNVLDVPADAFPTYKILEGVSGDFYVLDLAERRSSPMTTAGQTFQITAAPDGRRLWAFAPDGTEFASVRLDDLHPIQLDAERPIHGVYDIGRPNGEGRTAIVLHAIDGDLGATLLNALEPDSARTKFYSGLVYGGLTHE